MRVIVAEKAKNDATKKGCECGRASGGSSERGVKELFVNEKRIDLEIQAWTATISQFGKRTDQWLSVMCSINTAIKVHITSKEQNNN